MRLGAVVTAVLLGAALSPAQAQLTRAERSGYTETSAQADVSVFLDSLERLARNTFWRGTLGRTSEGRPIEFVVASRPLVRTAATAKRTEKPIVFVQGNIHGGEVEGKESLQALLRELVRDSRKNVLDSLILIIVPIYNVDGNEALGPQERNRGSQNGPAMVGQRPNGMQLDLNRDYIKAEAPETQAALAFFRDWDPDVFVDLHTTNGSYHGYALTYAPSLHPAAMDRELTPAGLWTRGTLLPDVRRRMRERHAFEVFDYGNFRGEFQGRDDPTKREKGGWETYEHKPRFGSNYYGLRNKVSVLSEAYSHDPFAQRVAATSAFVRELLSYVAENSRTVTGLTRRGWRGGRGNNRPSVPIRAALTENPVRLPVLVEVLEASGDSLRHEAGLRPGFKRTYRSEPVIMPVYDRFDATKAVQVPVGWVVDSSHGEALARLRAHGIKMQAVERRWITSVGAFRVDSIVKAPRAFQGHQEVRLEGTWATRRETVSAGSWFIPSAQELGVLATVLLEPESDDGLTTWNFFDAAIALGKPHPVRRVFADPPAGRR